MQTGTAGEDIERGDAVFCGGDGRYWVCGVEHRAKKAMGIAEVYGQNDGAQHKAWVIDQMVRALTGPAYEDFVKQYERGGEYLWDVGTPP